MTVGRTEGQSFAKSHAGSLTDFPSGRFLHNNDPGVAETRAPISPLAGSFINWLSATPVSGLSCWNQVIKSVFVTK